MQLLQVSAYFPAHGGGIEIVAGWLAKGLSAEGMTVRWMAGGPATEVPADMPPSVTVIHARSVDLLEKRLGLPAPMWTLSSVRALYRLIGEADAVQIHDYLYMPTLLAVLFARVRRKPLVVTQHIGSIPFRSVVARALLELLNRSVGRWVLGRAGQVVFVGKPVQRYFEGFVRFRRPPLLIPNGVDHSRFNEAQRPAAGGMVRLLFVGRFVEKKGMHLLRPLLSLRGVRWTFVGHGPLSPRAWPEVSGDVTVFERLAPVEVAKQYQHADLLVLPSVGEGFPLVVQEALACGTPVLVSREVADAFPLIDRRCVFEVDLCCADPQAALRAQVSALARDPQRLADARAHAAALARQWSWQACVKSYRAVFDVLCGAAQT